MTEIENITKNIDNTQILYFAMTAGILYMSYNLVRRMKRLISQLVSFIWITASALGTSVKDVVLTAINIGGHEFNLTPSALAIAAAGACAAYALTDITRRRRFFR